MADALFAATPDRINAMRRALARLRAPTRLDPWEIRD